MFEFYDTVKIIKDPCLYLVADAETGTLAVRKTIPLELVSLYETIAELDHPGITKIYEIESFCDHAHVYYAYASGQDLAARLAEKPCTKEEALSWIEQLCDILHLMHSEKPPIIHRDIKPSNIIIGEDGRLKLIDFGAARTYREGAESDTYQIGTRGYAAPEQYGYNQSDARTDIYALGVLFREMMESAGAEEKYASIIAKCTHIYPKKRFSSARHLMRAIRFSQYKRAVFAAAGCLALSALALALVCAPDPAKTPLSPVSSPVWEDSPTAAETPAQEAAAAPAATPSPTPTPTPLPQNVLPLAERLPFLPGRTKVMEGSFDSSVIVYSMEKLDAALAEAWADPSGAYQIFFIDKAILCEKDLTVPPNVQLRIAQDSTLEMAPGTCFSNYGEVLIFRNGMLRIGEGGTLNGGNSTLSDNDAYRNIFPSVMVFDGGSVHMGKDTLLTAEENTGHGPRFDIDSDGSITFADPASTRCEMPFGYCFMHITFNAVKDFEDFDFANFRCADGTPVCIPKVIIDNANALRALSAVSEGKDPKMPLNVFILEDITLSGDRALTFPDNIWFILNGELTLEPGASLTFGERFHLEFLPERGALTVCADAALSALSCSVKGSGQPITVFEGAAIPESLLSDYSALLRFE